MPEEPREVHAFPLTPTRAAYTPEETKTLLDRARQIAPDPSIFDDEEPYFWGSEVSNANLDSYYTHQLPSSLQNYAKDAEEGRSFQNSHNWRALGMGRTCAGKFHDGRGGKRKSTSVDTYTLRDLDLNGLNTNQLIRGIRSGIASDVSIGFYGGQFLCDLCGRDMLTDWDCWHIPGLMYELKGEEERAQWQARVAELMELSPGHTWTRKKGEKEKELILCTAGVENAHLSEVSAVYDGACPGAAILKAQREATEGRLRDERLIDLIQTRYRIALPTPRKQVQGADVREKAPANAEYVIVPAERLGLDGEAIDVPGEGQAAPSPSNANLDDERRAQILAWWPEAIRAAGLEWQGSPEDFLHKAKQNFEMVNEAEALKQRVTEMEAALAQHTALVEDGKALRADLLKDVLEWGVRAHANAYNIPLEERTLANATIEDLKARRVMYQAKHAETFKGGRITVDTTRIAEGDTLPRHPWGRDETAEGRLGQFPVPPDAYKS